MELIILPKQKNLLCLDLIQGYLNWTVFKVEFLSFWSSFALAQKKKLFCNVEIQVSFAYLLQKERWIFDDIKFMETMLMNYFQW